MRVITIIGARPQFVKAAPVCAALGKAGIQEILIHTGQHFDTVMSQVFFDELGIPAPHYNLEIHGGSHGEMTGRMLASLEPVMSEVRPEMVIVYGDTNSTLAGALIASKLHIPIAHIEAGLRSFNRRMPEEINRVLTDHVSSLLLCPTRLSVKNLEAEGITAGVHHVGDVMYDATLLAGTVAERRSRVLESFELRPGKYAVATVHRAETTDDPAKLAEVLDWLRARAIERPVIFPIHPRTRARATASGLDFSGLRVCDPVGYLDMARLLGGANVVYTDSGGLQKEAYFHRTPCVTLRSETEWVETVECGWNRLWQGPDYAPRREIEDYGDGHAADVIVEHIMSAFGS